MGTILPAYFCGTFLFVLLAGVTAAFAQAPDGLKILRPSTAQLYTGEVKGKPALAPIKDEFGMPAWKALDVPADAGTTLVWRWQAARTGEYDLLLEYQLNEIPGKPMKGPLTCLAKVDDAELPVVLYRTGAQFVLVKAGRLQAKQGARSLSIGNFQHNGEATARLAAVALYPAVDGPVPYRDMHCRLDQGRDWLDIDHLALPTLISDHRVLQRDVKAPIWGRAQPKAAVTVEIAGQRQQTKADTRGRWRVLLNPLPAGGPFTLTIRAGEETRVLQDVLVGEVWLGAGQSNMTWALAHTPALGHISDQATQDFVGKGDFPLIRVSSDAHHLVTPNNGSWIAMPNVPETRYLPALMSCTAILLHRQLKVPVGIIVRAFGGTTGASWVDRDSFENDPDIQRGLTAYAQEGYPKAEAAYRQALANWEKNAAAARDKGEKEPAQPGPPPTPDQYWAGGSDLYAAYITPVLPYAVRGIVWDQGESGTGLPGVSQADMLAAIARGWRTVIGSDAVPFIYIRKDQYQPIADVTTHMNALGHSWMVDNEGLRHDLHPPDKLEYAKRLVAVMMEQVYAGK